MSQTASANSGKKLKEYLIKDANDNHWKGGKENIIERLKPIVIKALTRKPRVECEPELGECEGQILVKEISNNLLTAAPILNKKLTHINGKKSSTTNHSDR